MSSSLLSTVPPTKSARIAVSVCRDDAVIVPPGMFVVDDAGIRIPPASSTSVVAGGGRHSNCALFPRPARQPLTAQHADPSLQALMLPFADGPQARPTHGAPATHQPAAKR